MIEKSGELGRRPINGVTEVEEEPATATGYAG